MGAQSCTGRGLVNILPLGRRLINPAPREKSDQSCPKGEDCIRAPPRRGRYWEIHPRCWKDFPRPKRFPEGEARGKSRGSREIWRAEGMDFPIPPEFWWSTDNLSASIFLQGVDQKILPCGQGRIDSVKSILPANDDRLILASLYWHSPGGVDKFLLAPQLKVLRSDQLTSDEDKCKICFRI